MSGYDLFLSDGDVLTTVNVKTVDDRVHTSLVLIGQGIPNYGTEVAQDLVWMLENFSKSTPPVHPLTGQHWHDHTKNRMNFYTGREWRPLLSAQTAGAALFEMLPAATNIDFTVAASTTIFTGVVGKTYFPTALILNPNGAVTAAVMPTFNVYTGGAGDILSSRTLSGVSASRFAHYSMGDTPAFAAGVSNIILQITGAASGGHLSYDAYLFGFTLES